MQKSRLYFDEENFVEGIKTIVKANSRVPVMVVMPDADAVEMVHNKNLANDFTDFMSLDDYISGDNAWRIQRDYKKVIIYRADQRYLKIAMGCDLEMHIKRTMKKKEDK